MSGSARDLSPAHEKALDAWEIESKRKLAAGEWTMADAARALAEVHQEHTPPLPKPLTPKLKRVAPALLIGQNPAGTMALKPLLRSVTPRQPSLKDLLDTLDHGPADPKSTSKP